MAIIDVGTNSILYLQVNYRDDGTLDPVHQEFQSVRLGNRVAKEEIIQEGSVDETIRILNQYKALAEGNNIDHVVVVGTHVFRLAKNNDSVRTRVKQETGLEIEVLAQQDEAQWSYRGAVYGRIVERTAVVLDIGGGSTEIIRGQGEHIHHAISIDMGAVVLTERFLNHDPPLKNEFDAMEAHIDSVLETRNITFLTHHARLIGVGGTVTSLFALACGMKNYDPDRVDGQIISMTTIQHLFDQMQFLSLSEREKWIQIDPRRADIILAGILILKAIMGLGEFHEIMVSDRGLRFGIALREVEKQKIKRG